MLKIHYGLNARIYPSSSTIENGLHKHNKLIRSTKFGTDSMASLHLVTNVKPTIPIVWIDTGYITRDTLSFVNEAIEKLDLKVYVFKPKNRTLLLPPSIDDSEHASFRQQIKLAPFKEALIKLNASHWLSSVRLYLTEHRRTLITELQLSDQLTKAHPMPE